MTLWEKIIEAIKKTELYRGLQQTVWAWTISDEEINRLNDCTVLDALYKVAPVWKMPSIIRRMKELNCPTLRTDLRYANALFSFAENPSEIIGTVMNEAMSNPVTRELSETFGSAMYDAVMGAAIGSLGRMPSGLLERIRRFMGTVFFLSVAPRVAGIIAAGTTGGKVNVLGQLMHDAYFNLGLGFITWQMTSPLLSAAIGAELEREANRVFRPTRFTLSQYLELYAKGFVTAEELLNGLAELGYRPEDVEKVLGLSYRNLSEAQVRELYQLKYISTDEAAKYLRAMGYSAQDIVYIMKLWQAEEIREQKGVMLSTARNAFSKGLISETKFREILKDLRYTDDAIELEIATIRAKTAQEQANLTVSQIKDAFVKGVIGEPETRKALLERGYSTDEVETLITTWKASVKPAVLKLNKTSVIQALAAGVIDEATARAKLRELGYTPDDVDIIIRTYYQTSAEKPKVIPVPYVLGAYKTKAIDRNTAKAKFMEMGFTETDAEIMLKMAEFERPVGLTKENIAQAYVRGILTMGEALARLTEMGMTEADATLFLRTAKASAPPAERKLTVTHLMTALSAGIIDRETFERKVRELGYADEDVEILLNLAQYEPAETIRPTAVISAYIHGVISREKAEELLRETGLPAEEITLRLDTADVQRERLRPKPGLTALTAALNAGIIDQVQFADRLEKMGYTPTDIDLFIKIALYQAPPEETPLTKAEILNAYRALLFTRGEAMARLMGKGYSVADAEVLIKLQGLEPFDTVIHKLVLWGLMDVDAAADAFARLGFTPEQIAKWREMVGVGV